MTPEWVFRRLVCCQIRRHGETKGAWRRDTQRRGAWTWQSLPGEPMSPVPDTIIVGSLTSLSLCGDPRGVRFGTAHFFVALQNCVTWGWCRQWRQEKGVGFTVQRAAVLAVPQLVSDRAMRHQHEGTVASTLTTPPSPPPLPPEPPLRSWGILWRPRQPPRTSGQPRGLYRREGPQEVLRYACGLVH